MLYNTGMETQSTPTFRVGDAVHTYDGRNGQVMMGNAAYKRSHIVVRFTDTQKDERVNASQMIPGAYRA